MRRRDSQAAIVGIGATEFSRDSGRSELRLALEAISSALEDAGLASSDVDGLVTYSQDTNPETFVANSLGIPNLTFFSRTHYGGGGSCATVMQAALAVEAGVADTVVCYRAFNERSERRLGTGFHERQPETTAEGSQFTWYLPFGLATPASWVAMFAQRYMYETGATSEDFGQVSVVHRRHASTNPNAYFYQKPITLEDHQQSRFIVEPLRLLDCCLESDGGVAVVVTSNQRAHSLRDDPVMIKAAAQGLSAGQQRMTSYYRPNIIEIPELRLVASQLWEQSGLTPADVQVAILYDHFTPFVLMSLEELGFCDPGRGAMFVKDHGIGLEDALPVNPHGGQLGEGYMHGMNGISEAVRQVRGSAVNQVNSVEHVLVTGGTGIPTSGLVLGRH